MTKAGIRYRYYVSLPCLLGEAKTARVGSVTRVPAVDIEEVVVKSLNEHLRSRSETPASAIADHSAIAELVDRIDVHKDRLAVRLRSRESPGTTKLEGDSAVTDDRLLSIPWQKPPFKRFRQILLPHGSSRREVRPERPERRLRLVSVVNAPGMAPLNKTASAGESLVRQERDFRVRRPGPRNRRKRQRTSTETKTAQNR